MKRPLLNQFDRFLARSDTLIGAGYRLGIARRKLCREIGKTKEYKIIENFLEWLNNKL